MDYKLVKVIWRDIASLDSNDISWFSLKQAKEIARKQFESEFVTTGYLLDKNKDFIVIAATIDGERDEPNFADVSMILASVIKTIIPLYEKEDNKYIASSTSRDPGLGTGSSVNKTPGK